MRRWAVLASAILASLGGTALASAARAHRAGGESHGHLARRGLGRRQYLKIRSTPQVKASKRAGLAAAEAALAAVQSELPAGAKRTAHTPVREGPPLSVPDEVHEGQPNLISLHRWWTVPSPLSTVEQAVKGHPPAGLEYSETASGPIEDDPSSVTYVARPAHGAVVEQVLRVTLSALSESETEVLATVETEWAIPTPAADHIPAGAQFLEITVEDDRVSPSSATATFTEPAEIQAVAAMINEMPENPSLLGCKGPVSHGGVKFTFRSAPEGHVLAVAGIGGTGEIQQGPCEALGLRLPESHRAVSLERGAFLREVVTLTGVHII